MKIAEIGVLPDYVGSGCAMGLLHKLWENVRERFDVCESGWILDSNVASRGLASRRSATVRKHYSIFEMGINDG